MKRNREVRFKWLCLPATGLMAFLTLLAAGTCKDEGTTPLDWYNSMALVSQFIDNGDATITDSSTGLMWMKCAYGQGYNAGLVNCSAIGGGTTWGAKSLAFCEAVTDLSNIECTDGLVANDGPAYDACAAEMTGSYLDWRLPVQGELVGLAGKMDRTTWDYFFPNTPDDKYFWTGSAKEGSDTGNEAYGVSFATNTFGQYTTFHKADSQLYLRCVRP